MATERLDDITTVPEDEEVEFELLAIELGGKEPTTDVKKDEKLDILVKTIIFVPRGSVSNSILLELLVLFELLFELMVLFKLLLVRRVKTAPWNQDCPILHIIGPPFSV